ncbi:glycosyl hydrolase 38 domain protein [Niastella koreensis GR20-10]|uniref:Glycosyl hydrolase 38 domain protein n=2 Tax=Niastella koreensis TaxID=354356 RepID=G8T7Y6_NIAKG|nr:glycosyl hydrolase 38 domain protein [Niastella koreensis GR20-10]
MSWPPNITGARRSRERHWQKKIEGNKAAYFEEADKISQELIAKALASVTTEGSNTIAVINTLSWPRNGLVVLPAGQSNAGDRVVDETNKEVPAQRLTSGELVFQSASIPALALKTYKITAGTCSITSMLKAGAFSLQNDKLSLTIDEKTGSIKSLTEVKANRELIDTTAAFQLNSFNYVPGVWDGRQSSGNSIPATDIAVKVKEQGPLIVSLLITSKAPGSRGR